MAFFLSCAFRSYLWSWGSQAVRLWNFFWNWNNKIWNNFELKFSLAQLLCQYQLQRFFPRNLCIGAPVTYSVSLQTELKGTPKPKLCGEMGPLGTILGQITDHKMSTSSVWNGLSVFVPFLHKDGETSWYPNEKPPRYYAPRVMPGGDWVYPNPSTPRCVYVNESSGHSWRKTVFL